jgi:CBS domain containing-hemolysin-like protein
MEPFDTTAGIAVAILLVLANGFFVAAEFAIVKVRGTQLQPLAQHSARARLAVQITHRLDSYLAACQVGVTLSSLGLGWIGEPSVAGLLEPPLAAIVGGFAPALAHGVAIVLGFALISTLHIVLGELAPKSVAIQRAVGTSLLVAYPLHWFYRATSPFVVMLNALGNAVVGLIGLKPATAADIAHSTDELALILDAASTAGTLEAGERDVARRALTFGERTVRSVMVPRTEMVSVAESATVPELLALSATRPFTRLPVHRDGGEEIVGVVHIRDVAHASSPGLTARQLSRPVAIVPENADLLDALALFRRERARVAVVVDEYGGTAGIVTLGAIAEQLIGPVGDEFEPGRTLFDQRPDGSLLIDGLAPLVDVRERLGIELKDVPAETVSGLVVDRLGRVAAVGDVVHVDGVRFEVVAIDGRRIERVRAVPESAARSADEPTGASPSAR